MLSETWCNSNSLRKIALFLRNLQRMSNVVLVPNIWIFAKWNLISNTLTIFGFSRENLSWAKIPKQTSPSSECAVSHLQIDGYLYPLRQSLITRVQIFAKRVVHIILSRNYNQPGQRREKKKNASTQLYLDLLELFSKSRQTPSLRLFCVGEGGSRSRKATRNSGGWRSNQLVCIAMRHCANLTNSTNACCQVLNVTAALLFQNTDDNEVTRGSFHIAKLQYFINEDNLPSLNVITAILIQTTDGNLVLSQSDN